MSFDARVSFEREEYTAVNERIPTCPFNCSNHGICVNAGFFRGMCVCFKGYAGFYCQNNATKLIPNDEESRASLNAKSVRAIGSTFTWRAKIPP